MIYKKYWHRITRSRDKYNYMGIFLFGFIPLYLKRSDMI
jgi:hypothetical protein